MALQAGDRLGAFEILAPLGAGGMGETYRARDTKLGRTVALKVLPDSLAYDPVRRARLKHEAEILATLNHPNIAAIHGWEDSSERSALVMELVEGHALDNLVRPRGLDFKLALRYAIQIASGLEAAHRHNIVHRDLKPSNVMITSEGVVKLLDFGVARVVEASMEQRATEAVTGGLTAEGMIVGTVAYMSPEQAQGKPLDTRSDLFSFGTTFYEMLTGRNPFLASDNVSTLAAILKEEPKSLTQGGEDAIPIEAARILKRCLRKDPERRFQTASDLRVALEELLEEVLHGASESRPTSRRASKVVWLATSTATILALVVGILVFWISTRSVATPELKQLTFEPGFALMPAVSPDGKLLAYVSDHSGGDHTDLWLKQITGGEALQKTFAQRGVSAPQFSADGTMIYYLVTGSIYAIPTLGGSPRKVIDGAGPFSISTRGEIAFVRIGTGGLSRGMGITSSDGNTTELWPECFSAVAPAWSPKGDRILIVGSCGARNPLANLGVYVGTAHGASVQRLNILSPEKILPDIGNLQRVSWFQMANGTEGLIVSLRSGDSQNLFRVGFDGKIEQLTQGTGSEEWPVVTAAGDVIFVRSETTPVIWSLPLAGDSRESPHRETAPGLTFSVSRDGSRLVFGRMAGADRGQFVLLDRGSGTEYLLATHEVSTGGTGSFWTQLIPDGTKAVYRVMGKEPGHYVVSTAGGGSHMLSDLRGGFGLPSDWSVDGKRILGECLPTQVGICELDYNSGSIRKVAEDIGGELLYPSWSWDQKWITFMRRREGRTGIWVAPMNGLVPGTEAQWIRISPEDGTGSRSRFAPDGESIFYLLDQNDGRFLVRQPLNSQKIAVGSPQRLASIPVNLGLSANSTVGVSKDRVFFNTVEVRGNIWRKSMR